MTVGVVALGVVAATSASPPARAAGTAQLQRRLAGGRQRVSGLTGAVTAANRRVATLNSSIVATSRQLASLQTSFEAKRAELLALRSQQAVAQARLTKLEAVAASDEQVLAQQLIGT
jgi:chromosome segregation ATPase